MKYYVEEKEWTLSEISKLTLNFSDEDYIEMHGGMVKRFDIEYCQELKRGSYGFNRAIKSGVIVFVFNKKDDKLLYEGCIGDKMFVTQAQIKKCMIKKDIESIYLEHLYLDAPKGKRCITEYDYKRIRHEYLLMGDKTSVVVDCNENVITIKFEETK